MEILLENTVTAAYQTYCPYEQSSSWASKAALVPCRATPHNYTPFLPLFLSIYRRRKTFSVYLFQAIPDQKPLSLGCHEGHSRTCTPCACPSVLLNCLL